VEKHHNRVNTRQPSELIFLVENFRHFVKFFLEKGMQVPCRSGKKNRQKNKFKNLKISQNRHNCLHNTLNILSACFKIFYFHISNITKLGRQLHLWKSQLKKNKIKKSLDFTLFNSKVIIFYNENPTYEFSYSRFH